MFGNSDGCYVVCWQTSSFDFRNLLAAHTTVLYVRLDCSGDMGLRGRRSSLSWQASTHSYHSTKVCHVLSCDRLSTPSMICSFRLLHRHSQQLYYKGTSHIASMLSRSAWTVADFIVFSDRPTMASSTSTRHVAAASPRALCKARPSSTRPSAPIAPHHTPRLALHPCAFRSRAPIILPPRLPPAP